MKSSLYALVDNWVINNLPLAVFPEPLTTHISSLLNRQIEKDEVLPLAYEAYEALIRVVNEMSDVYMATLIIPLTCVDNAIGEVPTGTTLTDHINYNEPPSLYVINRQVFKYFRHEEKHSYPIALPLFKPLIPEVYVHYDMFRSMEDIENNWEYTRVIQADQYPAALRL